MRDVYPTPPNPYDTTDTERLAQIDKLVARIANAPTDKLVPNGWEDEEVRQEAEMELIPDWKVVPNPWDNDNPVEAAHLVSEDPDGGSRAYSIVRKKADGSLHIVASLYRPMSDRLLMMPRQPDDTAGFTLITWSSLDAAAFLAMSDRLF